MSDNRVDERERDGVSSSSSLQNRPERRGGRRTPALLLLIIGVAVLVGGVIALLTVYTHVSPTNTTSTSTAVPTSASSAGNKQNSQCTGERLPFDTVQQEVAQGLHLTVDQIKTKVSAGKTITQIATAQGISASQLDTIEVNALKTANARWVGLGCITQAGANDNMKRDTGTAAYMNDEFTQLFQ